jgi:hypothetical protein
MPKGRTIDWNSKRTKNALKRGRRDIDIDNCLMQVVAIAKDMKWTNIQTASEIRKALMIEGFDINFMRGKK